MPNGLTSAPRWYTKLMKPIFSKLRNEGLVSVYYLDDTWLMGRTKIECQINVKSTRNLLEESGFLINLEKSHLMPSQTVKFLGFILDSVKMRIYLPPDKREKIISLCNSLLIEKFHSIRYIAKVIGVLVSSLPAVQYGALFYRYLEHDKIIALRKSFGNFDSKMNLSLDSKSELQWWLDNALICYMPIKIPSFSLLITTDASKLGWGAVFEGQSTGGHWNSEEIDLHINELEMKAINFALKSFLNNIKNIHIRIRSDNTTAVAYINNLGGVKSLKCHSIAKNIWTWAFNRDVHLSAEHLPGSENSLADKASRIFDENTEWSLNSDMYSKIVNNFGELSIDLFASRLNAKHVTYASWKPDPSALFVDSFSKNWSEFNNFYAFPPFSMIMKCLQKISEEEAQGIMLVPLWPTQPWFPKIMRMLISPVLILPRNIIHLPFNSTANHKQSKNLHLIACHLSGIISKTEDFQKNLSTFYALPGDPPQLNSMKCIFESGFISVINKKLIPCNIMK